MNVYNINLMTTMKHHENPFAPGAGIMPVFFSGRKHEIKAINQVLNWAKAAYKPKKGHDFVVGPILALVGPRGIGKTLLLSIASDIATENNIQLVELTEADVSPGLADVVDLILPEGKFEEFFKKHRARFKGKVPDFFEMDMQPYSGVSKRIIHDAMSERLKKGPLLISIDEAHALSDEFLRVFYQQAQKLMRRKQPLCVILAGTPSLRHHRRKKGLTFSERWKFLEFNLLSDTETQDAFVNAFLSKNMTIEPKALKRLTQWSDNYPYFLQMAGYSTWDCIDHKSNKVIITLEVVNKGIKEASEERESFHAERVNELRSVGLFQKALQVIKVFNKSKNKMDDLVFGKKIMSCMKNMNEELALELEENLLDLGFLYRKGTQISPGIPSLFDHIKRRDIKSVM